MDLNDLLNIFRRRLVTGAAVAFLILAAVAGFILLAKPIYQAVSTVEVLPAPSIVLETAKTASSTAADELKVNTELEFINSRSVAELAVVRAGLADNPEFGGDTGSAPVRRQLAIEALTGATKIARRGTTYLIDVTVKSGDAKTAARLANEIADSYMTQSEAARIALASRQSQALKQQLGSLGDSVRQADSVAAQYRGATGIVSGSGGTVTDQQISGIAGALASADSAAAEARGRADAATALLRSGNLTSVSEVLSSAAITELRRQRGDLVREQARVSAAYGPRHPDYIRVAQQISDLDGEIQAEAQRIVQGLNSAARASESRAAQLRGQLNGLRGQQNANARASVEGDSLEREAAAKRQIYDQLALTAQQATQSQQLDPGRSRIVERARPPLEPIFPNKKMLAALGAIIALAVGLAAMLIAEALDRGLRTIADVELRVDVPALASIPHLGRRELAKAKVREDRLSDFVVERPMTAYAETIRTLRAALRWGGESDDRVIGVASAIPNDGKSTVAASLARVSAMGGTRTVLVDCDLRMAKHRALSAAAPTAGLVELLAGKAALDDALTPDVENLHILSVLKPEFSTRDLLGGAPMRDLLATLKQRFEIVIVDTPPLLSVADAMAIAAMVDTNILVVRSARTPFNAVKRALEQVAEVGGKVAGVVLNDVQVSRRLLSESDAGYYYSSGSKYYR